VAIPSLEAEELSNLLTIPADRSMGDFTLPCFTLARNLRKAPQVIASELAAALVLPAPFVKAVAVSGYLNVFMDATCLVRDQLTEIDRRGAAYGCAASNGKTVVIDFSSPNVGKQLAFHHLRSTMIGNALYRIYKAAGWKVIGINHLGDWGTQFGKLIVMARRSGRPLDDASLSQFTLTELNAMYVQFGRDLADHPEMEDEARAAFAAMEAGDPEALRLWTAFRATTLTELHDLYHLLGVPFDEYTGESFFNSHAAGVIALLEEKGLLTNSQERDIVSLEAEDMPPCLIRKSDGSTLYATRDLAAALHRQRTYGFDRCLYVVDNGQALHFKQVFTVLGKAGFGWAKNLVHIPFGLILHKDAATGKWSKGSSKQGNSSTLRQVFEAAQEKILAFIAEKNPELADKEAVAMQVGIGALVFNDLKNKRLADVHFDWDQALSFEGDTGPYVQNAHVRLCSIQRKAGRRVQVGEVRWENLLDETSLHLVRTLGSLPARIQQACDTDEPSALTQYSLEIAAASHRFIHHNQVIGSDEESDRLFLVQCAQQVLQTTLNLLGIKPIERM